MEITAVQFEKQSLLLLHQVQTTHEEILITQDGKPIARLIPAEDTEIPYLDLMREGIGCIENGPADLSSNPKYLKNYGA